MRIIYEAVDGTWFETKEDCEQYEAVNAKNFLLDHILDNLMYEYRVGQDIITEGTIMKYIVSNISVINEYVNAINTVDAK